MSELQESVITLGQIEEHGRTIKFSPELKVEIWHGGDFKENCCEVYYDFGMRDQMNFDNWLTRNLATPLEKIRKCIEFELFHAFFHPSEDPNYTVLNWALYGNLKERVELIEDFD